MKLILLTFLVSFSAFSREYLNCKLKDTASQAKVGAILVNINDYNPHEGHLIKTEPILREKDLILKAELGSNRMGRDSNGEVVTRIYVTVGIYNESTENYESAISFDNEIYKALLNRDELHGYSSLSFKNGKYDAYCISEDLPN
jgi:hypothetical protein